MVKICIAYAIFSLLKSKTLVEYSMLSLVVLKYNQSKMKFIEISTLNFVSGNRKSPTV